MHAEELVPEELVPCMHAEELVPLHASPVIMDPTVIHTHQQHVHHANLERLPMKRALTLPVCVCHVDQEPCL